MLKKKKYLTISLITLLISLVFSMNVFAQVELRYAEVNGPQDSITMAAEEFAKIVEEKSNGEIKINVYPSGQLGGHTEVIQALQMGAIDMARTQPAYLVDVGVDPLAVFSLPYIFRDTNHAWNVLEGPIGKDMLEEIDNANVSLKGIGYYATSPRNFFFTDKRVTKLEDLEGLKIRVPTGEMYRDMIEAFGASPTPIAFSELYSALQTGVVDGAENPVKGYYNNKYYEITDYYTLDRHQADPSVITISKIIWDRLNEEQQEILKEALKESAKYYRELSNERIQSQMQELEEAGVEILEVEDPEKWREAVKPLYEKYGEGHEELIERIQNID